MKLSDDWYEYLYGYQFNSWYKFPEKENNKNISSRLDTLVHLTNGNKIIHLGACDHLPIIEEKIKSNRWLHKLLSDSCESVIGIDIASEAVKYCRELGWDNIYCYDMLLDSSNIMGLIKKIINIDDGEKIDYLVAGEIVEHLENPVDFLKQIKYIYGQYIDKLIISVPNVYFCNQFKDIFMGYECINTDHKYWFTPYTIAKVLACAGMKPVDLIYVYDGGGLLKRILHKFINNPVLFSESIICVAEMNVD